MLDRWVSYLKAPKKQYPFLKDWQAMISTGGSEDQAKALGDSFPKLGRQRDVGFAQDQKGKRHHQGQGRTFLNRWTGTAKPNEFETDDQFCPGCLLELKTLPTDKASLWVDLFLRAIDSDR